VGATRIFLQHLLESEVFLASARAGPRWRRCILGSRRARRASCVPARKALRRGPSGISFERNLRNTE
jgi:hypothetical protein